MIWARMAASPAKIATAVAAALAAALAISACGSQGIQVAKNSPYRTGAELFATHCSGCHTLSIVGAEGSASSVQGRLRTNGPNFNYRKEGYACVVYAIENGGFSGQIMPQDIGVGSDVKAIALFLAKYAGRDAPHTPTIGTANSCSG
jgi:mono/diheme cytochrome c family protein